MHFFSSRAYKLAILASALIAFPSLSHAQDITTGLINHWTLDDTSGTTAADSGSLGNDGTMYADLDAAADSVSGRVGSALRFEGTDQTRIVADTLDNMNNFTACTWFSADTLINEDNYSPIYLIDKMWNLRIQNATTATPTLQFIVPTDASYASVSSNTTISAGQWYHVCSVHNGFGNAPILYINGVNDSAGGFGGTGTTQTDDASTPLMIGAYHGNIYFGNFTGIIDDVRIYNRSLSAADIALLYENSYACNNPSAFTGHLTYNSDYNVPQYCNGTEWISAGKQSPPSSGLVGHWKLDETSGATIVDSSGNGLDGTWSDSTGDDITEETTTGQVGNAISFDGSNDYIGISDNDALDFGTSDFSFSTWVKIPRAEDCSSAGNGETIVGQRNPSDPWVYLACHTGDQHAVFAASDSDNISTTVEGTTALNDNTWHHVVGVKEGHNNATLRVYVDGNLQNSASTTYTGNFDYTAATPTTIGQFNVSPYYNVTAEIDDVRIYNRALSASEIQSMYNAQHCQGSGPLNLEATIDTPDQANDLWLQDGYIFLADQDTVRAYTFDGSTFTLAGFHDNVGLAQGISGDGRYIYFITAFGHTLNAATFDGSAFTIIDTLNLTDRPYDLTSDGEYIYVGQSADGVVAYTFDGTSFTQAGSWADTDIRGAYINNGYIYGTRSGGEFYILRFNGSDFTLIQSYDSPYASGTPVLDFDGQTIFVAFNSNGNAVTALNFDGTTITEIDNIGTGGFGSDIWYDGTYVYATRSGGGIAVFAFDGTNLTLLETSTDGTNNYTDVIGDGHYIYQADSTAGLHAYSGYSACYCAQPVLPEAALTYNTTSNVMQFCNGSEWVAMGVDGAGGAGCSTPSGVSGSLIYNASFNTMQYCDGAAWHSIGQTGTGIHLSDGLVGHWMLDETSGVVIVDSSGNGNNGTWTDDVNNDVTEETIDGAIGTGLILDGTDDFITVPHDATLDVSSGYTVSSWVYFDSTQATSPITPSLIGKNDAGGWGSGWTIGRNSGGGNIVGGNIRLGVQHNRNINSPGSSYTGWIYPVDTWNYVTISWDGSTIKYYLNGALLETDTIITPPDTSSGDLTIGYARSNWYNTYHDGYIDDMRLYDRALNDAEITELYNIGTPPTDVAAGLIAHWALDETSGSVIADSSGNGNNATWTDGGDNIVSGSDHVSDTPINNGLYFSGADPWFITHNSLLGTPTNVTIAGWVNTTTTDSSGSTLATIGGNALIEIFDDRIEGTFRGPSATWNRTIYNTNILDNGWTHLAFTINDNSDEQILYVNGIAVASQNYTDSIAWADATSPNTYIGRHSTSVSYHFIGEMDDVRIYNRAISATEVTELYDLGTPPVNVASGLVHHWTMDDSAGSTATDIGSDGNDGTLVGTGAGWIAGPVGGAYDLDGTARFDITPSNPIGTEFTVAAWARYDGLTTYDNIFGQYLSWWTPYLNSNPQLTTYTGGNYEDYGSGISPPTLGQWYHFAWSYDVLGVIRTYVDGAVIATSAAGQQLPAQTTSALRIGASTTGTNTYLNGAVDDLRVYSRKLSDSEITALYDLATGPIDPSNGLAGHWTLDDTSGSVIADSSGNGNDGTWTDTVNDDVTEETSVGPVATALNFDGINDYIDLGSPAEINSITGSMTVSTWIYPEAFGSGVNTNPRIISRYDGGSDTGMEINIESGAPKIIFRIADTASTVIDVASNYTPPLNEWTHITGVFEAGVATRIYINGTLINTTATAVTTQYVNPATNIKIGGRADSCANCIYNGSIDDVRIYGDALSDAEITAIYNLGTPPAINSGLVGHWALDETSGSAIADSSGNGNTGTWDDNDDDDITGGETNAGPLGTAINFDGVDDRIDIGTFNVNGTGLTLAGWYYLDAFTNDGRLISKSSDANNLGTHDWTLYFDEPGNSGRLTLRMKTVNGTVNENSDYIPDIGEWHHIAVTYDNATDGIVYYIDGVQDDTDIHNAGGAVISASADPVAIGNQATGAGERPFDGMLDDWRVYDRPLSASEVTALYDLGTIPAPAIGIVGHWTLDETSGSMLADSSGNGYDGIWSDSINDDVTEETETAPVLRGLHFDGTDDRGTIPYTPALQLDDTEGTISAWIKLDSNNIGQNVSWPIFGVYKHGNIYVGPAFQLELHQAGSSDSIYLTARFNGDNQVKSGTTPIQQDTWYHVSMTWDNTNTYIYLNGVLEHSGARSSISYTGNGNAYIGNGLGYDGTGDQADGVIDDVRLYNYLLSASEITDLYDLGTPPDITSDLAAHWTLDETSGTTASDSVGSNDGTMTGMDGASNTVAGPESTALSFSSSRITAAAASSDLDDIFNGGGTISYWIYPTNWGTFGRVIDKSDSGSFPPNAGWHSQGSTGITKFSHAFSTTYGDWETGAATVPMNTWSHITITYDNSSDANTPTIYVNGVNSAVTTITAPSGTAISDATQPITLGARQGGGNSYTGYTDDVRMYNRELSGSDVMFLYSLGSP